MLEIEKFRAWNEQDGIVGPNGVPSPHVVNESIVGEEWSFGKAIYDSLERDQTPGERK